MKKRSKDVKMLHVICLLLTASMLMFTGCEDTNTKGLTRDVTIAIGNQPVSRTILPQEYPTPDSYTVTLKNADGVVGSPITVSHNNAGYTDDQNNQVVKTVVAFPSIYIGSYTLEIDAFLNNAKIYSTLESITVTASGSNEFVIVLNPIHADETGTGSVEVSFDLSKTDRSISDIELMISDGTETNGVLNFVSQGKTAVSLLDGLYLFSKDVSVGKNQYAMFKLWNGSEMIGETGVEVLHVFLNMTSTPSSAKNYIFTESDFQPAEGVKQASATAIADENSNVGLRIEWTNPRGSVSQVLTWKVGNQVIGTYTTVSATESAYEIMNLSVNTSYQIDIVTHYASGLVSMPVTLVKDTVVPVANVTLAGIPEALQKTFVSSATYQLSPIVTSAIAGEAATDLGLVWSSSDISIAQVLSNGNVIGVKPGKATITVTTVNGNKSASTDVVVYLPAPIPVASADVDGINITWPAIAGAASYIVKSGETTLTTVPAGSDTSYSYKHTQLLVDTSYAYSVQAVAVLDTLDVSSSVSDPTKAITPATPSVSIALPTYAGDITDGLFSDINNAQEMFNLVAGNTLSISVTPVTDAVSYQWMLNNTFLPATTEPYITIINENTVGLKPGVMDNSITLVVTDSIGTKYSASTRLYYLAVADTGVNYTGPAIIKTTDGAVQLTANVTPSDASIQNVKWTLTDPTAASGICTLTDDGLFTALDTGAVNVTMTTHSGATNTATISSVVPVSNVAIMPTTANGVHFVGGQNGYGETKLEVQVTSANGKAPTNSSVTWSSSDASVVSVDQNGNIKPLKAGTATITVASQDESNLTASYQINSITGGIWTNITKNKVTTYTNITNDEGPFTGNWVIGKHNNYYLDASFSSELPTGYTVSWAFSDGKTSIGLSNQIKLANFTNSYTVTFMRGPLADKPTLVATVKYGEVSVYSMSCICGN